MRRTLLATLSLPFLAVPQAALAGGGCHTDGPAQPERATKVVVEQVCFGPVVAAVPLGTEVTWVNTSGMAHNITGPAMGYTELPPGAEHKLRFDRAGIWVYACTIHPGMSGAVIVAGADAPATGALDADVAGTGADTADTAGSGSGSGSGSGGIPGGTAGWAGAAVLTLGAAAIVLARRPSLT